MTPAAKLAEAPMMRIEHVSAGPIRDFCFTLSAGSVSKLLFDSPDAKQELLTVLTGLRRPDTGQIFLLGEDLYALGETERLRQIQHLGVVPQYGGMISNLKAWENLVLPLWYHRHTPTPETEKQVANIFHRLGMEENALRASMGRLPDQLTLYEKRAFALARAMLMQPDVMIYDFTFAGLDREAVQRLLKLTQEFHTEQAGRVSLYLCPADDVSERLPADQSITVSH